MRILIVLKSVVDFKKTLLHIAHIYNYVRRNQKSYPTVQIINIILNTIYGIFESVTKYFCSLL